MGREYASARALIEKAVSLSSETNDDFGLGASLGRLADIANAEADYKTARELTNQALIIFRKLGYREGVSTKLNSLGSSDFALGDYEKARAHFDEALAVAAELEEKINTRLIFDGFAALAAQNEDFLNSARLAGFAESLGASVGYAREPAEVLFRDKYMEKIRAALNDADFNSEYNAGLKLSLEEATKLTRLSSIATKTST
ncbi:MAG: tetratricopeptide repeat protein [Pyrinomonadaceae bacterium]